MDSFPTVVTHNYDPARGIARNICDLPVDEAEHILAEIRRSGTRRVSADYLIRRKETEHWLAKERRRLLGDTACERPAYFFLGDFADGRDPSRPCSLVMPLTMFPSDTITFTYSDSMASLPISEEERHRNIRRPFHGRVFSLDEIKEVVLELGLPGSRGPRDSTARHDNFIEMQVWDTAPIRTFLGKPHRTAL